VPQNVAGGAAWAPLPYASTADAVAKVLRAEGIAGFYRCASGSTEARTRTATVALTRTRCLLRSGFGAVLSAVPAASAVYFGGYELSKRAVARSAAGDALGASGTYVLCGLVAQAAAGLVYTPMDVVKERMQVQQLMHAGASSAAAARPRYRGSADAAAAILRSEGVRGMFRGYWAANAAWWPWNVVYFVSYEHARDAAAAAAGDGGGKEALPPHVSALCATAAATLATVATNPVDVVKTRLQTMPQRAGAAHGCARTHAHTFRSVRPCADAHATPFLSFPASALDVARAMWAAEGAAAFGAGMSARVLSIAPGSFISFFTYEAIKRAVSVAQSARASERGDEDAAGMSQLTAATP
jgi:solute carrier family 25 citrate transporter 1